MNTPRRNIIALLIICTTIVGVVIFVDSRPKKTDILLPQTESTEAFQPITVASDIEKNKELDSDNDGLKDWEETVWKTDPQNPDSDGDGKMDGQEVSQNHNPTKAGPNDILTDDDKQQIGETSLAAGFSKNSVSDNFSKKFFENYLLAKKDGSIEQNGPDALVKDAVAKANSEMSSTIRYTKSEMTTFGNDQAKIKEYGTLFAQIQTDEIKLIVDIARNKKDLPAIAKEYKVFSEKLFRLPIPEEIAETHIQIINNFYTIYESYITLSDYAKDPVKSLFAIKENKRIGNDQVLLYTRIKNYFTKNGIIFDTSVAGEFWGKF